MYSLIKIRYRNLNKLTEFKISVEGTESTGWNNKTMRLLNVLYVPGTRSKYHSQSYLSSNISATRTRVRIHNIMVLTYHSFSYLADLCTLITSFHALKQLNHLMCLNISIRVLSFSLALFFPYFSLVN